MPDDLQQAIIALKSGQRDRARQLLLQLLKEEPHHDAAWVWLSRAVNTPEWQRACLDRALSINPDNPEAHEALLDLIAAEADSELPGSKSPPATPATPPLTSALPGGANLKEFLQNLHKNLNLLKEREAKYATAAPLDLLNQIDDYQTAIALTEHALELDVPMADLQAEFGSLNLQISTVVFVGEEKPRHPFTGANPYRGLRKFTEEDAKFFFGRNAAIQSVLGMVQYLVDTETSVQTPDLIAVLGPSGSGKSSLVRAGLIPVLWDNGVEGSFQWPIKVMLPGEHPLDALALTFAGEVGRDLASIRDTLAGGEKALHDLMVESLTVTNKPDEAIFVLVIDQFEELFSLCEDEAERRAFIEQILYAAQTRRNRCMVLLTMRSDFYSKVAAYKPLAEAVTRQQMLVSPLTEKELREAILLPAETVGLELEKELVERLLADTADAPGVLPLLQHALLELFHRRDGNLLTLAAYNEIGGVQGALAHRADSVVNELTPDQQQTVRRIFLRLIQPGEGTIDTRRRAALTEVLTTDSETESVEGLVQTLANANLLTTSFNPEANETVLDVSHEALIQKWPLLRHWLDEDREGLRIRQQLSQATRDWQEREHDEDSLYRGARLLEAEEWVETHPDEINPLEQSFIAASVAAREQAALERRKRTQRFIAGLIVGLVLVAIAAVFGFVGQDRASKSEATALSESTNTAEERDRANLQSTRAFENEQRAENEKATALAAVNAEVTAVAVAEARQAEAEAARADAEQQARLSQARELAIQSQQALSNNHQQRALLLAIEAFNTTQKTDPYQTAPIQALRDVLPEVSGLPLVGHNGTVSSIAFSPDNQWLATASTGDETVRLWSVTNPEAEPYLLENHRGGVGSLTFSPDNQWLAVFSRSDGAIWLWSLGNFQTEPRVLQSQVDFFRSNVLTFSPDGRWLAHVGSLETTAGTYEKIIQLWPITNQDEEPQLLQGHEGGVKAVTFSSNGEWLAVASDSGVVRLWSVEDLAAEPKTLFGNEDEVDLLAFSPDSRWLATGGDIVRLWSVNNLEAEPRVFPNLKRASALGFNQEGNLLIATESDSTVWSWSGNEPEADPEIVRGYEGWAKAFSPNCEWFITTAGDNTIQLWSLVDPEADPQMARGHEDYITSAAFSPDGQWLATGSEDGSARLWSVDNLKIEPMALRIPYKNTVWDLAFSPNNQWLGVASPIGNIFLWPTADLEAEPQLINGYHDGSTILDFSPDGQWLATASSTSNEKVVLLWRTATLGAEPQVLLGHEGYVNAIAFSPDGKWLATASTDFTIRLWSLDNLDIQPRIFYTYAHTEYTPPYLDIPKTVTFSPDSQWLAIAVDKTVQLQSLIDTETLPYILYDHESDVSDLAFSLDGQWLASASNDGTVRIWSFETNSIGSEISPVGESRILLGHESSVHTVAFSPDSYWLATASEDNTIRIWSLMYPKAESQILRSEGVTDIAFSPDGKWLVTGNWIDRVWFWHMHADELTDLACKYTGRNFTFEEWQRYFPEGYTRTCLNWPKHPSVIEGIKSEGQSLVLAGKCDEAMTKLNEAITLSVEYGFDSEEIKQDVVRILETGWQNLAFSGQIDEAIVCLKKIQIIDPESQIENPERNVKDLATHGLMNKGNQLVEQNRIDEAIAKYKEAISLAQEIEVDFGELDENSFVAYKLIEIGAELAQSGEILEAVAKFEKAKTFDPAMVTKEIDSAWRWNTLCRQGSLWGHASLVKEFCNEAVTSANEYSLAEFRDSRGINRALLGDYTGAIEDFEEFVKFYQDNEDYQEQVVQRQGWIEDLRAEKNPFDDETLEQLKSDE
ncbi:MAG: PD40 domain-containing protein [Anaerolineae bacterium]|nr:PD40 domain-containing protein [Anaerolineae bacterium]